MDRRKHLEAVTLLVGRFGHMLAHQSRESKNHHGITVSQTALIMQIGHCTKQGGLTVSEIADRIGVSKSAVTQIVDTMFEHGLVERVDNPNDKRSVKIVLTDKSKKYLKEYRAKMIEMTSDTLGSLDDNELESFHKILHKIVEGNSTS